MQNLPNEILLNILEKTLSSVSDLTEVKKICTVNKQFAEICKDDYLWYLIYKRNIDPEVMFESPIYITWKDSILETRTAFTTDKIIDEEVIEFLNLNSDLNSDGNLIGLAEPIRLMITDFLENFKSSGKCSHTFQTFWWINSDSFDMDLNQLTIQIDNLIHQNGYLFNIEDIYLDWIFNPYGKLYYYEDYRGIKLWSIRKWWERYSNLGY